MSSVAKDMKDQEYLTIGETAKKLRLAKITIYRMARKGKLPAIKIGRSWRISNRKLTELFEKPMTET